ncbi:hypothetical protein LSE82_003927 [Salmonella enterica]|nr:hypothetical protein [Salmonella enterica]
MKIALFLSADLAHFAGHERATLVTGPVFAVILTGSEELRRDGPAFTDIKFFAGVSSSFFEESSQQILFVFIKFIDLLVKAGQFAHYQSLRSEWFSRNGDPASVTEQ